MPIDNNPNPEYKRAMVVVAHPDDAEYGCSGTVAQWCSNGWEVVYVLCTDGSKGSDDPEICLLYTSPSPRDATLSRMPSSA